MGQASKEKRRRARRRHLTEHIIWCSVAFGAVALILTGFLMWAQKRDAALTDENTFEVIGTVMAVHRVRDGQILQDNADFHMQVARGGRRRHSFTLEFTLSNGDIYYCMADRMVGKKACFASDAELRTRLMGESVVLEIFDFSIDGQIVAFRAGDDVLMSREDSKARRAESRMTGIILYVVLLCFAVGNTALLGYWRAEAKGLLVKGPPRWYRRLRRKQQRDAEKKRQAKEPKQPPL